MRQRASMGVDWITINEGYHLFVPRFILMSIHFSIEHSFAAAQTAIESDRPSEPATTVSVTAPGDVVDDEGGDWDFGNLRAGPSGGEQRRAVLSSICDFVSQLGLSDFERGLDVLNLADAGISSLLKLVSVRATLTTKEAEARARVETTCWLEERLGEQKLSFEELPTFRAEHWEVQDCDLAFLAQRNVFAVSFGWINADQDTVTARVQVIQSEISDQIQQVGVVLEAIG